MVFKAHASLALVDFDEDDPDYPKEPLSRSTHEPYNPHDIKSTSEIFGGHCSSPLDDLTGSFLNLLTTASADLCFGGASETIGQGRLEHATGTSRSVQTTARVTKMMVDEHKTFFARRSGALKMKSTNTQVNRDCDSSDSEEDSGGNSSDDLSLGERIARQRELDFMCLDEDEDEVD
jgi:hypothetical protein